MEEEYHIGPFWAEAVRDYEQECGHDVDLTRESISLQTTDDILHVLVAKSSDFKSFRQKHAGLWTRLKSFADPIAALGSLATNVLLQSPSSDPAGVPSQVVLRSITHLLLAGSNVANAYDWIETVFSELQSFSDRLTSHIKTTITSAMRGTIIAILAFILRIIGRSELLIKRGRIREYLRTAFIGKDQKTLALLEELNKVIANEGRLTLALTHEKTEQARNLAAQSVQVGQQNYDKLNTVQGDVGELIQLVEENAKEQAVREVDQKLVENLRHTLKTTASTSTDDWYSLLRDRLLRGSASWLQKEPFFDLWMQHRAPILWVFGGPGAGKTMLSTWLISLLMKQFGEPSEFQSDTSVAYFFIKENVEDLRNPNLMFKTMAWQIQQTDISFRNHAAAACGIDRNIARAEDTWEKLFLKFYQGSAGSNRRVILVIDGLDEAELDTQRRILTLMKEYVSRIRAGLPARIQFAVFGRTTLRLELEKAQLDREEKIIEVSSQKNHEDMTNYITERLKNLAIIRMMQSRKPNGPKDARKFARTIRQKILDGAGGVFLWAQLLLDQMEGRDDKQITKVLASPPSNLYDMIYSVFHRLSRDPEIDIDLVNRLLSWVAFARRPLSFGELDVLLRPDAGSMNWFLWNHMRGKFASLLRLRYPKGWNFDNPVTDSDTASAGEEDMGDQHDTMQRNDTAETDHDQFDLDKSSQEDEEEVPEGEDQEEEVDDATGNAVENEQQDATEKSPPRAKESEADRLYSWGQKHTVVDFSHQRFRDHLIIEGDPTHRRKPALTVGIQVHSVQIQLVLDCLRTLRAGLDNPNWVENYVSYPAMHMFSHLAEVEMDKLDKKTKTHIQKELCWLMRTETGCRTLFAALASRENGECDAFWGLWLANNDTTSLLQRWFSSAAESDDYADGEMEWMREATASVPKLLEPLAMTAAKMWLQKESYRDLAYLDKSEFQVWFIKGYRALDERGIIGSELSNWISGRDLHFYFLDTDEIQGLAEWADLEKTTHWYTGVGWILFEGDHTGRARELLFKAMDMDSTAWVAMEAIARSYGQDEDYTAAVSWMESALETIDSPFTDEDMCTDSFLIAHLSRWKERLGERSASCELANTAWMKNVCSLPAINSYVRALIRSEDWGRLMYVLEYIDDCENGYGVSYLVRFFSDYEFLPDIGFACRAHGFPEFIMDAVKQALREVEKTGDTALLISQLLVSGDFSYTHYERDREALDWWGEALSRIGEAEPAIQRSHAKVKVKYTNAMARVYFDIAVANFENNVRPNDAVTKLKRLASATTFIPGSDEDIFAAYTPGYPSALYGRWLRQYENAEPSVWRKCFRARILEQMNGLDDDDPTNDTAACQRVAMSLFQADDEKRAGAIFAVLYKTLEDYLAVRTRRRNEEAEEEERQQAAGVYGEEEPQQYPRRPGNLDPVTSINNSLEDADIRDTNDESTSTDLSDGCHTPPSTSDGDNAIMEGPAGVTSDQVDTTAKPSPLHLQLESYAWEYLCDGCGYDAESKGSMSVCEHCSDIAFCDECLDKVKNSTLGWRVCNPAHTWYKAWPLNEDKVKEMALEYEEGGIVTLRKEWLQELRNEWLKG